MKFVFRFCYKILSVFCSKETNKILGIIEKITIKSILRNVNYKWNNKIIFWIIFVKFNYSNNFFLISNKYSNLILRDG